MAQMDTYRCLTDEWVGVWMVIEIGLTGIRIYYDFFIALILPSQNGYSRPLIWLIGGH